MAFVVAEPDAAQRARKRTAARLLPFLFLLYVIAFLDRMNIGAAALQMPGDLGFSDRVVGLGAGIFFVGYVLLEIPGALIVERWSARRWMARIMISWGLLTALMAFIHTARQFYAVRFLVGAAEAGFFPGVIVYVAHWFQTQDRAKAFAKFFAANPVSYVIGSPLAGLILGVTWLGLRGWRWLFVLEGIPAVVFGVITVFYLTDWPHQAKWLRNDERQWIAERLAEEKAMKQRSGSFTIWQALGHRDVWLLTGCYFFAMTGNYGIGFWLPTILKRLSGQSNLKVTLLASLPYLVGIATQQWNGWHSDLSGERRRHTALPLIFSGFSLGLSVLFSANLWLCIGLFTLMGAFYFAFQPAFWAVPSAFLGESAAAVSIGLINAIGNLGGLFGPWLLGYVSTRTHSFTGGLLCLVGSFCLAGLCMLAVGTGRHGPAVQPSFAKPSVSV
jgi:MFS transporter, ACS family, tartrate transporter